MRCILAILIALGLQVPGAAAQSRVVVIPSGSQVVVPPRGGEMPAATRPRAARARRTPPPLEQTEALGGSGGIGLAIPLLSLIPLAAAVALSATLPGSGSGTSSPARTR